MHSTPNYSIFKKESSIQRNTTNTGLFSKIERARRLLSKNVTKIGLDAIKNLTKMSRLQMERKNKVLEVSCFKDQNMVSDAGVLMRTT